MWMVFQGGHTYLTSIIINMFELHSSDTARSLYWPTGMAYIFTLLMDELASMIHSLFVTHQFRPIHISATASPECKKKNPKKLQPSLQITQWAFEAGPLLLFGSFNAIPVSVLPRQCLIHRIHLISYSLASFAYIRNVKWWMLIWSCKRFCVSWMNLLSKVKRTRLGNDISHKVYYFYHQTNWLYLLFLP